MILSLDCIASHGKHRPDMALCAKVSMFGDIDTMYIKGQRFLVHGTPSSAGLSIMQSRKSTLDVTNRHNMSVFSENEAQTMAIIGSVVDSTKSIITPTTQSLLATGIPPQVDRHPRSSALGSGSSKWSKARQAKW